MPATEPVPFQQRYPLTVPDVARQLGVSRETVRRLVRVKALDAVRANRSPRAELRFTQQFVDDYEARRRVG